jgi:hypothetical protein
MMGLTDKLTARIVAAVDALGEPERGGPYVANPGSRTVKVDGADVKIEISDGDAEAWEKLPCEVRLGTTDIALAKQNAVDIVAAFKRWERRLLDAWEARRSAESDGAIAAFLERNDHAD